MSFTKLSAAAVQGMARVIEQDPEFRERVVASLDEATVGRAGWLWLTQPEGWEDELAALRAAAAASAAAASEERDERDARRRLAAARAAAERATASATASAQGAAEVRAELVEERNRRRGLEDQVAELQAQLGDARAARAAAIRQLKLAETKQAQRATEAKEARARLRELEQQNDTPAASLSTSDNGVLDLGAIRLAIDAALRRADQLSAALQAIDEATTTEPPADIGPRARRDRAGADRQVQAAEQASPAGDPATIDLGRGATVRIPRALPGGIRDDSVEAAEHLLRNARVLLAVDGYNVSMVGWPDLPVAEQRRRLVGALAELAARTGAAVEVIFDGADVEPIGVSGRGRQLVCVRFSPAGVEADDVLLDLVSQLPPTRPVVVASSDNRVRAGSRQLGANLVHAAQLVALLRR